MCIFRQEMWGVYRVLFLFISKVLLLTVLMVSACQQHWNDHNPSTWDTQSPSFACCTELWIHFLRLPWQNTTNWVCGLEQQNCFVSQFWRLEVWSQDVSRGMLHLKALAESPFLPLPCFWWLSVVFGFPSCSCITPVSASIVTWLSSLHVS